MEIKLIICFSCVTPAISFQRLKILLVALLFFIVEFIFLKQFVKLLIVKYTYLLTSILKIICKRLLLPLEVFCIRNLLILAMRMLHLAYEKILYGCSFSIS